MAGDIISLTKNKSQLDKDRIDSIGGNTNSGVPIGERSSIFYNDSLDGVPRRDNLFAVRLLGQMTQIEWLKDIIKHQVASTDFKVVPDTPEGEEPDQRMIEASNEVEQFLNGNFNTDNQSFDDLLKVVLDDVLDFDSGIVELVRDNEGFIDQLITRDGLTFTKNVKETGLMPEPGTDEPAYYQFSPAAYAQNLYSRDRKGIDVRNIQDELSGLPFSRFVNRESIPFGRDQIVWFSENPVSYDPYGRGRTQKVRKAAEIVINGDNHRNTFFTDNEFHKGVLAVDSSMSQDDKKALKNRFKNTAGNERELPIVGTAENLDYISIDPEPEKMQFLESQKWYTKLVTMAYGLNDTEAGLMENANKGITDNARKNVWNRTTQPILEMIERKFNNEILPFTRPYEAVNGSIKFVFEPQNEFMERMELELMDDKLNSGTVTLNEAREELGKEAYDSPIADTPKTVFESYAQTNPASAMELLTGEEVPEDSSGGGSLFESLNISKEELEERIDEESEKSFNHDNKKEEEKETGDRDLEIDSYRKAFKHKDEILQQTKDALRNERGFNDVPGIVDHKNSFRKDVSQVFESINLESKLEEEFPDEEQDTGVLVNADEIVDQLSFKDRLGSVIETNNLGALEMSAEHHEQEIESETEERLTIPEEAKVEISYDVMDTFTADIIRQEALSNATEIEGTVKDRLKNAILQGAEKGEGIDQITRRIEDVKTDITRDHAELVARTETLSSSRKGSQALAESTDLVAGKEWISTQDSRVRKWHEVMDGEIVGKDDQFVVPKVNDDSQPNDYPRNARVVGEDQVFNCRCSQAPVLAEDMPDSPQQLEADFKGVSVDLGVTKRQFEVWKEHGQDFDSYQKFWKYANEEMSKTEIAESFEMSKTTVYNWQMKNPEGVPEDAYPVESADDCDGSTTEGPRGGLYCVPEDNDDDEETESDLESPNKEEMEELARETESSSSNRSEVIGKLKEEYGEEPITTSNEGSFPDLDSVGTTQNAFNMWGQRGYWGSDVYPIWKAAQEASGRDAEIPEDVKEDTDGQYVDKNAYTDEVTDSMKDVIAFSQEYARQNLTNDEGKVVVKRGISGDLAEKARQAKENDESLEINPRAMESWTTNDEEPEEWGDVVIEKEFDPEDVGYIGSATIPSKHPDEVTMLGKSEYEITADQIEVTD